jgi:hypothetical protein
MKVGDRVFTSMPILIPGAYSPNTGLMVGTAGTVIAMNAGFPVIAFDANNESGLTTGGMVLTCRATDVKILAE